MRKTTFATLFILFLLSFNGAARSVENYPADKNGYNDQSVKPNVSDATPLQFSIWPTFYEWPTGLNVHGVRLGLPFSFGGDTYVNGVDLALS